MKLSAAAIQMAPAFGDVPTNLARLEGLIGEATNADLIVAPELVTTGYDLEQLREAGRDLAEPANGATVKTIHDLAADMDTTLVVGFLELGDDDNLYDSVVITSPAGTEVYRKTHLYPPELDVLSPGERFVTATTPGGSSLGAMICFEHAFPEIARTLALDGAQILVIPSAVPVGYEHLLELRTRARAQDNQVFVVASNLTGSGFIGGSLIVDPRGRVLAAAGVEEGHVIAEVDLDAIERERRREPALRLRRPDLYK